MITYDYILERDKGQGETRLFHPGELPKELSSIVMIEGPNSLGKSTLLNIIALGLFGNKNRRINPLLQDKLNALLDLEHQKLTFSFKISLNSNLILESEKTDFGTHEINVKESLEGKVKRILTSETFERDYNLIYDIPNNPTERLKDLLKELKEEQSEIGNQLRAFSFYLHNTIGAINNSRDLARLGQVRKQLDDATKRKSELETKIPELKSFTTLFEKKALIFYYCKCTIEGIELTKKKEEIEKTFRLNGTDVRKRVDTIHRDKSHVEELQKNLAEKYNNITPVLKDLVFANDKSRFTIWAKMNPYCFESADLDELRIESSHYIEVFGSEVQRLEKDPIFRDANLWEQVIGALKDYENSGLTIPKFEVTIQQFIKILKDENQKSNLMVKRYHSLNILIENLKQMRTKGDELQFALNKFKQQAAQNKSGIDPDLFYRKTEQLNQLKKDLESLAFKCNDYYQKCLSKGIDEKSLECPNYRELTKNLPKNDVIEKNLELGEKHVLSHIVELQKEIEDKRIELSGLNIVIPRYEKDVKTLEEMKPHKFETQLDELNKLHQKTTIMTSKILSDYSTNLNTLMREKREAQQSAAKSLVTKKYYEEVSKYLAHRLGSFRHIDKMYKAKVVDLISGTIISEDNEVILLNDMGTGQTQSAYITSLLNISATDSRKIIAMFDEIAMMDDMSLEPILMKMKELKQQGRLVLGILVQRSNKLKITTIGE